MSHLSETSLDESYFTAAYSSTVNAKVFNAFIEDLLRFYVKRTIENPSQPWLIVDHVPYQKSKMVLAKLKHWKLSLLYLSPYTPEFSQI